MLDLTRAYDLDFLFPASDTAVGASLRDYGEFARVELDFLADCASGEQGALIDVGANIGAIALPFAARKRGWRVIAVEAHRDLAGVLAANAFSNHLYNVEVIQAAAGRARQVVDFPTPSIHGNRNFGGVGFHLKDAPLEPVRMLTLDETAPAGTQLVKIDVEGFEPEVLAGASELIARRETVWLVEATVNNPAAAAQVIETFRSAGYGVHWFYAPFATPRFSKRQPPRDVQGDANIVALPPNTPNRWELPAVDSTDERRPGTTSAYPYLSRYGY
ncbi:hypothetical protein DJ021_09205 [Phenylobacterium hankyongense]|uniref:Methyltransferase FkbM domain-containing protein n=1 Tax=Phenylobacterium hankyongense TaxID=1813876 RepID=A0A328B4K6_9CAUL|nr:FkbM family methyltransferase [Phenylobacterium hankyongense]RAK59968.1 hypothetical protein DJ021_09205 [Phenylobacterium hankyongense]